MNSVQVIQRKLRKFGIAFLALLALGACGQKSQTAESKAESGKLKVTVTTTFLQDMTEQLAGDYTDIALVIPAGEDPHSYEAKPEDREKFKSADLVLYHGLHFEGHMTELLEAVNGHAVTASFDQNDILPADSSMGLAANAADPHFWFDVKLYEKACDEAAKALIEKIPAHEKEIQANLKAYREKLEALDAEIRTTLAEIPAESRILVTPHDAFHYFSRRYGIEVKAPQGVSTDAELSTNDMAETADFIVAHKIKAIFAESTTDPARMEKLKESCAARGFAVEVVSGGSDELYSDSLAQKGEDGDTYITMVEHNVKLIAAHLK